VLIRLRLGALLALAVAVGALSHAPQAMAAAEVHRLNLVISAIPTQLNGGGMNDLIDRYNQYPLGARGFQAIDKFTTGWVFDGELRYFVRPNFALAAGIGHLKVQSKREFLPGIGKGIDVNAEVLTVPIHVGTLYYLAPYTQGDFQARAFLGAGILSLTSTRGSFSTFEQGLPMSGDTLDVGSLGGTQALVARGDAPGYYAEVGAHMFFAARYSLMVGAIYRSARIAGLVNDGVIMVPDDRPTAPFLVTPLLGRDGKPVHIPDIDLTGVGVRMALGIGF
jgi:hypothetical protein